MVKRRIFVIATDSAGCFFYRLHLPLRHVNGDEFEVHWSPPDMGDVRGGDIVIGQRIAGTNTAWEEMCAHPDLTAVYDIDDDLLNIDPSNAVPYQIYQPLVESTAHNIRVANVVTVSTPNLADKLRVLNPNVHVLPNCLQDSWVGRIEFPTEHLIVGWAGSMFHAQDWGGIPEQLTRYARREPRAAFHMIGADYTNGAVPRRVSPWTTMEQYWASLDFHIGIAPLAVTPFNENKSWVKVAEYAGKGIPAVAARVGQYPEWIEHGVNGFLYDDPAELSGYLLQLSDNTLRSTMSNAAMEKAAEFTISRQVARWEKVYREA